MKTVSIDFDGVIHAYSKGWQDGSCYDGPLPGAIEAIKKLMKGYSVFILSTRDSFQILEWFEKHAPEIGCDIIGQEKFWNAKGRLGITDRKLPAMIYIDDRGYLFRNWEETIKLADLFAEWPGANLLSDQTTATVDALRDENATLRSTLIGNTCFPHGVPPLLELAKMRMTLVNAIPSLESEVAGLRAELEIRTRQRDWWNAERNKLRNLLIESRKWHLEDVQGNIECTTQEFREHIERLDTALRPAHTQTKSTP